MKLIHDSFRFVRVLLSGPNALTATDVNTIITRAAQQANITRAAMRQPLGGNARVSIAVVDTAGVVLGVFRQQDAPVFGFDVSVQKARTAAFFPALPLERNFEPRIWFLCRPRPG